MAFPRAGETRGSGVTGAMPKGRQPLWLPAPSLRRAPLRILLILALLLVPAAQAQWTDGASNPYGESPIRIHVDATNLTVDRERYLAETRAALDYWEAGGNGAMRWTPVFEEVATPEEARLLLWFEDAPAVSCGGRMAAGCGGFHADEGGNVTGIAVVAMQGGGAQSGPTGRYLPYATVREVVMHEVGHALGLRHSDVISDVMYRHVTANGFADAPGDTWLQRNPAALLVLVLVIGTMPLLAWKLYGLASRQVDLWRERRAMAMAPRRDGPP